MTYNVWLSPARPGRYPGTGGPGSADGRTLTMRAVTQADVDGLDALFKGLSDEDRYCRLFGLHQPDRTFLEQMTRAGDEGGYRLVAVASGPEESLAAETGYAILPGGDGEFTMTIAPEWQGRRLGACLLDTLVAVAAARGVPSLQADILLGNSRMLRLLSRRGYIELGRNEFFEVRVAIDAAQPARARLACRCRLLCHRC